MHDIANTWAFAVQHGGDNVKWGITGFCWGGRITWLYDAFSLKSDTPIPKPPSPGTAWSVKIRSATLRLWTSCPPCMPRSLGLYGGKDDSIPQDSLEQMRAALKANDKPGEIIVYPEAGHGFFADYRPSYDPQASADAWQKCLSWFAKYLA